MNPSDSPSDPAAVAPDRLSPVRKHAEKIGNQMVDAFVLIALFVLGGTIVWSAVFSYIEMMDKTHGTIEDILLLFIYLELGAMVGVYFKTGRIPAQFLLYIAITVLTRMLASVTVAHMDEIRILVIVGAILVLAVAVLILRLSDAKYGIKEPESWLA